MEIRVEGILEKTIMEAQGCGFVNASGRSMMIREVHHTHVLIRDKLPILLPYVKDNESKCVQVPQEGRQKIAIKRLSQISGQGAKESKKEVLLLPKLQDRYLQVAQYQQVKQTR